MTLIYANLRVASAAFLSFLCLLGGRQAMAGKYEVLVPLRFVPTKSEEVLKNRGTVSVSGPPIEILNAVDGRPGPHDLIGEAPERWMRNTDSTGPRYEKVAVPIRATSSVADWVTRTLSDSLRGWGITSTPGAGLVLQTEIVSLFVLEADNTYRTEANMRFSLKNRDGMDVWLGLVVGADSRWGLSLSKENYQEGLSDAVFACYAKLWVDPGFREAWAASAKKPTEIRVTPTKVPSAETMKPEWARKRLLELRDAGFDDEALAAWVKRVNFSRPFAAEDMLDLNQAGMPLIVIRAAMSGPGESLEPSAGTAKALALQGAGFGEDDLVAWIRRVQFTRPFNSTDMLQWKSAGVPQAVIRAAME